MGFSDRFALKRHRNIHEKYGRTKPATSNANAPTANNVTNATAGVTSVTNTTQDTQSVAEAPASTEDQDNTNSEVMVVEPKYEAPDMTEISELQAQLS